MFAFAPPPPPPVIFLAPRGRSGHCRHRHRRSLRLCADPGLSADSGLRSPPAYIATPPPNNIIYNNVHNTVIVNNTTNNVTIRNPAGQTTTQPIAVAARGPAPAAGAAPAPGAPAAAGGATPAAATAPATVGPSLPPSVAARAAARGAGPAGAQASATTGTPGAPGRNLPESRCRGQGGGRCRPPRAAPPPCREAKPRPLTASRPGRPAATTEAANRFAHGHPLVHTWNGTDGRLAWRSAAGSRQPPAPELHLLQPCRPAKRTRCRFGSGRPTPPRLAHRRALAIAGE